MSAQRPTRNPARAASVSLPLWSRFSLRPSWISRPRWIGDADATAFDLRVGAKRVELRQLEGSNWGMVGCARTPPPGTLDDGSGVLGDLVA